MLRRLSRARDLAARSTLSVLALLAALSAAHASGTPAAQPTLEQLREDAQTFARIFEGIGTWPNPYFKGKVTLPPPAPTPGASTPDDIAWSSRFALPVFDADVTALVRYRGRWIAAGIFGVAPGARAHGMAEWDGQRWRDFAGDLRGGTRSLASDGTTLYASGSYDVRAGSLLTYATVVRRDGDRWVPLPGIGSGNITKLRVIRGTLYAAGQFRDGAANLNYPLARWTGSAWVRVGPALPGPAFAVAEHNGRLVIAGNFGAVNGPGTPLVMELESPTHWNVLAIQDTSYVRLNVLESFGGKLYVGGSLEGMGMGGAAVASWDGAAWTPENLNGYVASLAVSGGKLWAGGSVWTFGGPSLYQGGGLASLESDHWEVPIDDPGGRINVLAATSGRPAMAGLFGSFAIRRLDPSVGLEIPIAGQGVVEDRAGHWSALAAPSAAEAGLGSFYGYPPAVRLDLVDGEVWASGDFQFARARGVWTLVPGIAKWTGGVWTAPAPSIFSPYSSPSKIIKFGGTVYVAYSYGPGFGPTNAALYRVGQSGWEAVPGSPSDGVYALAVHQGALVVAGRFSQAGGAPAASIARYDGTNWTPVGDASVAASTPELVPTIVTLLSDGADLWVGGSFQSLGGVPAMGVARWNGSAWRAAGAGLQSNVNVLAKYRGKVVAGGDFYYSGSEFTGGLAAWDGSAWHRVGPANITVSSVRALAEARGSLFVGGYLWLSGAGNIGLARFDGQRWEPLGSGLTVVGQVSGDVRSLATMGDELWVSGRFSAAGGKPAYSVSTWNLRTGSFGPPVGTQVATGIRVRSVTGTSGAHISFALEREGAAELGVFDVRGARIRVLAQGRFPAGAHEVEWNGRDAAGSVVAPGVYFLQLRVDGSVVANGRVVSLR